MLILPIFSSSFIVKIQERKSIDKICFNAWLFGEQDAINRELEYITKHYNIPLTIIN